jgi:hypothetical protein
MTWRRNERRTETMIAASVVSRKTMKKIGIEKYSSAPMVRTRIDRCAKKKKKGVLRKEKRGTC